MQPVDRDFGDELSDPVDRLLIALRAYVTWAPRKPKKGPKAGKAKARQRDPREYYPHNPPSDWVLVFDCETRTTPEQRLRFGAYQLRYLGQLWERGAFYEPEVLTQAEQTLLHQVMEEEIAASNGERSRVLTRAEFVEEVFTIPATQSVRKSSAAIRPVAARDPPWERPPQHARRLQPQPI
jgi:hypothetical protein